ncbi:unnamed protein product [Peronospora belbahrii]|uniref:Reverse transcriptase domain-containing protein n=1 Tax=Peronospora belbahrii TaxID=622444 RepID=A0AAU9KN83_9STRA|nr:unnamed protein product [Peronospora belbahrii]
MTKFQRRAHLSLLYKSGDRTLPANYRPLTLLNHDAKLGPKVLAYRMRTVLPTLIHEDQSGFIPGRSIRHSLLRFQDLQDFCKLHHPDACAILLDFAKAFDSVLWPALDLVLDHFGFGPTFRAWIKTFYTQLSVSILLNVSPGDPFVLGAGVRQGDPLSPGLFVLFVEPMMNFLRSHFSCRGISVDPSSEPHLLVAFVDDRTGLLENVDDADGFLRFLSVTDTVTLLGIPQGATITPDMRFSRVLVKLRARCAFWKYRARTLRGKVVFLRSVILPLLWYTASVTCFTAALLKAVAVIIRNFIHGNDTASDSACPGKFSHEWIYTSIQHGGLGLTPVKESIQAMHLKSLGDAIAATCRRCAAPRWMAFALSLCSLALGRQGSGFDILYAVVKDLGLCRQQEFVDVSSTFASSAYLKSILRVEDFPRPASKTRFITEVIPRLNLLVNHDSPSFGPVFPRLIESARHDWSIDGTVVADMTNRDFVRLLLSLRFGSSTPSLPLQQLGVPEYLPSSGLWILEYGLDRHVLPVAADVKFRLQHNALGFRYKFCWRTEITTSSSCIHDCDAMETAIHLSWLCPVAKYQWNFFLQPFRDCLDGNVSWIHILFPASLRMLPSAIMVFGNRAILIVFHVVRCCVLRSLWLHRNKRLYNPGTSTNAAFVSHHCFAYVDLHLRTLRSYAERKQWQGLLRLVLDTSSTFSMDTFSHSTVTMVSDC